MHRFQRLDKDSSGSVSYEDMEAAFREAGMELDRDQVQEMCSRLDLSQCGRLDYATFVAAAIDKKRVLTDRTLATIFAELDLDGDGLLGAAELHAAAVEAGVDIDEDTLLDLLQREGAVNAEGLIHPDAFQVGHVSCGPLMPLCYVCVYMHGVILCTCVFVPTKCCIYVIITHRMYHQACVNQAPSICTRVVTRQHPLVICMWTHGDVC